MDDLLRLNERIFELIKAGNFDAAEAELHQAQLQARNVADHSALDDVLSLLVMVQCRKQPPDLSKAESYCLEREQVIGTGYAKAQYAMTLYWSIGDPVRTVTKAREAIVASREEGDDKTAYQSLGLLGLALLDTHQDEEALSVLNEICQMVSRHPSIVVGDETLFLERLGARANDTKTVTMIQDLAKTLSPVCRDPAFKARLQKLAQT